MQFSFLILVFCFFIFLFCVYIFSQDDYMLIRKNISLEQMFNIAFIAWAVGIVSARIFYVLLTTSVISVQRFSALFSSFSSGFSLSGGILGVVVFLHIFLRKKSIPRGRIYDIFFLSFFIMLPVWILLTQLLEFFLKKPIVLYGVIPAIVYGIGVVVCTWIFLKGRVKDGIISLFILLAISAVSLLRDVLIMSHKKILWGREDVVFLIIFVSALILLIRQQLLSSR